MADHDGRNDKDHSVTEPLSAQPGHATHDNKKADAETLGETSGGFLGAVGGLSLGIVGGPVGAVLGGIAGAVGGWWAGKGIADAITAGASTNSHTFFQALNVLAPTPVPSNLQAIAFMVGDTPAFMISGRLPP